MRQAKPSLPLNLLKSGPLHLLTRQKDYRRIVEAGLAR